MKTPIPLLALLSALLTLAPLISQGSEAEADQLMDQVIDHFTGGTSAEGAPIAEKRLELCKQVYGPNHVETAMAMRWVGIFYQRLGRYAEAEPFFRGSLDLMEKLLKPDAFTNPTKKPGIADFDPNAPRFPDTAENLATALGFLAELLTHQGGYEEAEALFLRSIEVQEKLVGPDGLNVADPLEKLTQLYDVQGRYEEAAALIQRRIGILEKSEYGEADVAMGLYDLALMYAKQLRYAEAEPLYRRSIQIFEDLQKQIGAHTGAAVAMGRLAEMLRHTQVDHADIEPLFRKALAIYEEHEKDMRRSGGGYENPDKMIALNRLAAYLQDQRQYDEAETLLEQCLSMAERLQGPDSEMTTVALNNLAALHQAQGHYAEAEPFLQRCLETMERRLGPDHVNLATPLGNLAELHNAQGRHADAEPLYRRSLEIAERHWGPEHPETAAARVKLMQFHLMQGQQAEAESLVVLDIAATLVRWRRTLAYFSERENLEFQRRERPLFHAGNQGSGTLAAEAQLRFKGAVLEAMNARRVAEAQLSATEAGRRLLAEREELGARYRQAYLSKGGQDEEVKSLQSRLEELDKEATILLGSGEGEALLTISLAKTQAALGADQALVESFRYIHMEGPDQFEYRYASTVIASSGDPVFVSHGEAESIESAIRRYRAHLDGSDTDAAPETLREAEATLHARLIAPLEEHLAPGQTVIFSPDAQLHFIPLGLLRDADGGAFAEKHEVRYVSSGRDLVKGVSSRKASGRKAFALGNPTYRDNAPMLALAEAEEDANKNTLASNLRAGMGQSSGSIQFRPLPGTAREVGGLSTLLQSSGYQVNTLSGKNATEQAVKQNMAGHDIIHLATHGFFLNELKTGSESVGPRSGQEDQGSQATVQNPMFRSGLALAGAQSTFNLWKNGQIPPPAADGVLLAAELTGIDLRGTDLVVLSACETAAGESLDGEGVMGLRRALNAAGATNVVMTLWPVDDAATVEVMEVFYQKYLSGIPAAKAMAETQRELLPQWIEKHGEIKALSRLAPFLCTSLGPVE